MGSLKCWHGYFFNYNYIFNYFTLTGYTINCTSVDHFDPELENISK